MVQLFNKPGTTVKVETLDRFRLTFRGETFVPATPGYDEARKVWNGMIDKHPVLIARALDVNDVILALEFARESGVNVSVRGGGHNVSGNGVNDGGVVIDLSAMKEVAVNPSAMTVRAEGGATIGDLDAATQEHGLAVPMGVVSETGIAGLTLGGGLGWLRRKYGVASDNLIAIEVVTADGRVLRASESENADLFWAARGGGGGFGVVTAFEYRAHPVGPEVYTTFVFQPYEDAADALRFFREYTSTAPEELSVLAFIAVIPPHDPFPAEYHGKRSIVFMGPYAGPVAQGEEVTRPLREYATPYADFSGPMAWTELQKALDEDYPSGRRYYWKSTYVSELSDEVIETLVEQGSRYPSDLTTIDIWHLGGAISSPAEDTAFANRDAAYLVTYESNWIEPADDEANVGWSRQSWEEAQAFSTGGVYLNFPGFAEGDVEQRARGENWERIAAIRKRYDPTGLFV
jgi:FAD/FMN-containing dehydrogenase